MHDITLVKLKKKEGGLEVRSLSPCFAISCWLSAFELWFAWGGTVSQTQGSALCPWTAEGRYPQPCSHVFCSFKECFRNLQGTELMGFPCCHYLWKGAMGNSCSRPVRLCTMIFWQHCRKKGVFFHLISNACLVMLGRGWCSGLFLFFFFFYFAPVLQIYADCRDSLIRPPGWDLMCHYKKWTGTSAESLPTFSLQWKQKSWTAIGTHYEGLSYF